MDAVRRSSTTASSSAACRCRGSPQRVGHTPFYAYDRAPARASASPQLRAHLPRGRQAALRDEGQPDARAWSAIMAAPGRRPRRRVRRRARGRARRRRRPARDQLRRPRQERRPSSRRRSPPASCQRRVAARDRRARRASRASCALPARVAVRVNPDFELKSSGMKMGGGPEAVRHRRRGGARRCSREIGARGLAFEGFHIFSGSQNLQRRGDLRGAAARPRARAAARAACAPAPVRIAQPRRRLRHPLLSRASSRSTSRPSARNLARARRTRAQRDAARRATRDRARPLPRRRGRRLRLPRGRPQGLARPGVPGHRRRPAPPPRRLRQLRPGDPQELSGGDRQPRCKVDAARSPRSSARCARRSTCSPTGWSWPRRSPAISSSCSSRGPTAPPPARRVSSATRPPLEVLV